MFSIQLDKYLIGFIVFSFFIVGSTFLIADINESYPNSNISTTTFNGTYNKINETYKLNKDIQDDMLNSPILGTDESWSSSVKNSYTAVRKGVTDSSGLMITIMQEVSLAVGIPRWIITMALAALGLAVIFSFIYMIFRFKG